MHITHKTILITGATGGLGCALIPILHAHGANIIAVGRNQDTLDTLARDYTCKTIQADQVTPDGFARITHAITTENIDILINASAVLDMQHITDATDTQIEYTLNLNLTSLIKLCTHALRFMKTKSTPCKIINISSVAQDFPVPYLAVYSATKYAVNGFTTALQYELYKTNVSALLVAPRGMDTPMLNPKDREFISTLPGGLDTPQTVAKAIVKAIKRDKNRIKIGFFETLGGYTHHLMPWSSALVFKILHKKFQRIIKT